MMDGSYEIIAFFISYEGKCLTFKDRLLNCSSILDIDKHIKRIVDVYGVWDQIYLIVKQAPNKTKNISYLIFPRKDFAH